MIDEDDVTTLKCLGLSEREAKVYLSLVSLGSSSVKLISKNSTVARQDTYRVISKLYTRGLVEEIISMPLTFKAIPVPRAVDILFQAKSGEIDSAISRKNELIKKYQNKEEILAFEEPEFTLVAGRGNIMANTREKHEMAKESISFAGPWEAFIAYFFSVEESLQKPMSNKVKIRVIVSKPESDQIKEKIRVFLQKFPNVILKYSNDTPFLVSVHDKKVCTYSLFNSHFNLSDVKILRSTNKSFIELILNYFDNLWSKL
jgi:HTH-type transcriptional regulator, sugar sensing transcriptional regulator